MNFYCPSCQQVVNTEPESTITTRFNQTAYKAHCPICQTDMAVYGSSAPLNTTISAPDIQTNAEQDADAVVREFAQATS